MKPRIRRGLLAACHAALASFEAAPDGSGDVSEEDADRIDEAKDWLLSGPPATLPPEARRLMRDLYAAVDSELAAAGADEVKHNPIFRGKDRLLVRVKRYLDRTK